MAVSNERKNERQRRREQGLCIYCGAVAIARLTRCATCAEKLKKNVQKKAQENEALGLCKKYGCNKPTTDGNKYCDSCNKKSTQRVQKRRKTAVEKGLCIDCRVNFKDGRYRRCKECHMKNREQIAAFYARRIEAGMCRDCGVAGMQDGQKRCEKCVEAMRLRGREKHAKLKAEVMNAYGGPICVGCNETEVCVLQIDHINGGGAQHAKELGGNGKLYGWLKKNNFPSGFRVLCANCNFRAARKQVFPNNR